MTPSTTVSRHYGRPAMVALLLVALSVGLGNFAASTAIGAHGVDRKLRLLTAGVFGVFEGGMPVIGLLIGHSAAHAIGTSAPTIGGVLIGLMGAYSIVSDLVRGRRGAVTSPRTTPRSLIALGAVLSIDNLVIGFALGAYHVSFAVAAAVIAAVSVGLSLVGLELGSRVGARLGARSGVFGGLVLIVVGVMIGVGLL